ncbi:MAG: FAD-binding protein [Solirubrobacterales bacterium]|nr:FAD-binding protein [Solirubrobacterales bacterium]
MEIVAAKELDEVVGVVERARNEGRRLRAVGSGHSYSDIALSDGYLVSVDAMDQLIDVDRDAALVRVQAGIKLGELNRALDRHGLAMPSLGEIDKQTLAGAVATDTHGSGLRQGSLSDRVASLELVRADGTVDELDGDSLRAARIALGSLGVVTAVTLRCVPAFTLRHSERPVDLDDALASIGELGRHDHPGLLVFPYARRAVVIERDRVEGRPSPPPAARAWVEDILLKNHVVGLTSRLAGRVPAATPALTRALVRFARPSTRVDSSRKVFTGEVRFPVTSAEWGLPLESAAPAIEAVVSLFERERYPVAMPVLCRFGAPSDSYLSTAFERQTLYLEVLSHTSADADPMIAGVEGALGAFGARPHWAKRFGATAADLAPLYPAWDRFASERARLDPDGLFTNAWTERVLGASGAPDGEAA